MNQKRFCREFALKVLFAATVLQIETDDENLAKICEHFRDEFLPQKNLREFAEKIVRGVLKNRKFLDENLQKIAPKWPIAQLSKIDRCVLEIGAWEIRFELQTPTAVILNEAIEIAKTYGDDGAGKFINAVLQKFVDEFRENEEN